MKEKMFSISIKDCDVKHYRGSGPGGQHRNKTETAVRITHPESGAIGDSQEMKSQIQNKRIAFKRMAQSGKFKAWIRMKAAESMTGKTVEQQIEEMMAPENLRIEKRGRQGWELVSE